MTGRWTRWGLIASVAVNVAVCVAIAAAIISGGPAGRHGGGPDGRRGFGGPPGMAALAGGFDRSQRADLFRALRGDEALRTGRERMRAVQADVVAALAAEPFAPGAFEAALVAQRDLQGVLAGHGIAVLSGVVSAMSPEERAAVAARMNERHRP